jgi:small-conductance mechanosensitive channel
MRSRLVLIAVALVSLSPMLGAQETATSATLVYFNRSITTFRAPLFGVEPEARATRAGRAIDDVVAQRREVIVSSQAEPQGNLVLVNGELVFILTEADTDRLRGETLAAATDRAVAALQQALAESRESRDSARLVRDVVWAAIGTTILAAVIGVVLMLRRSAVRYLARLASRAAAATKVGGAQVVTVDKVLPLVRGAVVGGAWFVIIVAAYRWLGFVLSQFPYTRPWGERLLDFFVDTAWMIGLGALRALPDLVTAAFILLLARTVIGLVTPFLDRAAAGHLQVGWLDADTARPTKRLVVLAIWLFGVAMAYPYLPGSDTEAFRGISVLLGVMATFGGASLFGQGASGLILMYSRTLRVGEYVRIEQHEGTVTEMGTFTTRMRTGLGEELTLPNSYLLGTVVKNYSRTVRGRGFIVDTTVTIGYDTPWRQVEAMLMEAARRTTGILDTPAPRVFQTALTDFYPEYRLVCQAVPELPRPRAEVLASLHANIQDVFNEHGVQIMSPHYLGDPAHAKVVPKDNWYAAPATPPDPPAR